MKSSKNSKIESKLIILATLILVTAVVAQAGGNYEISQSLIGGGGGTSTGAGFILNGAIGQKVITQSSGSNFQLSAGFYQENNDLVFFDKFETNN